MTHRGTVSTRRRPRPAETTVVETAERLRDLGLLAKRGSGGTWRDDRLRGPPTRSQEQSA